MKYKAGSNVIYLKNPTLLFNFIEKMMDITLLNRSYFYKQIDKLHLMLRHTIDNENVTP